MFGLYKCYQIFLLTTCGKGMFRIFCFLKIVKEEHELLKKCFEEPKSVSVKNINRQIINRNRSCFNREHSLSCSFPLFL